jgi:histidinol-phosphate aminotransferase
MNSRSKPLVPSNIEHLKPYVAGKTIAEVVEQYHPAKIAKLASNENRLGCSSAVASAVQGALSTIHDYPDPIARKLRGEIAKKNRVNPAQIMLASGSESILSILCRTFFLNHENAVTADATFVGFFVQAGVRGVDLKKVPVTADYKFDVDAMLAAIDENTKMVYLANPNNPTGTYLNKSEYQKLISGIPDSVLLIADEAYFEYARDVEDYPHALDYFKPNVIILRTFSKAYGLAGFRIGYCIADEQLITEMMKTKLTFEPTACAQAAAMAAYGDEEHLMKSVDVVVKGRERLYKFFDEHSIKYAPSISNSVMMILDNEDAAIRFTQSMLEEGVILRRINAFGLPSCVRITIGLENEMDHFEKSFKKVMQTAS